MSAFDPTNRPAGPLPGAGGSAVAVPLGADRVLGPAGAPRTGVIGPAADPVGELAERFGALAARAVHPLEIAARIEAEGLSDRQIRIRYGREDAFVLARELFEQARRVASPAEDSGRRPWWQVSAARCALRGVLFALPATAGLLVGAGLRFGPGLVIGLLLSWSWSQAVAHRAYGWLHAGNRRRAAGSLLRGGVAGVVPASLVVPAFDGFGWTAAFGLGQALYFATATLLLVLGRERRLLTSLLPMAAGACWALAAQHGLPRAPGWAGALLLCAALLATVLAAWRVVAEETEGDAGAALGTLPGLDRRGAVELGMHVVFGAAVAALTLAHVGPATVALTLSMGGAEWFLTKCRGGADAALGRSGSAGEFRRAVVGVLLRCLGGYLVLLTLLVLAVSLLWAGPAALPGGIAIPALGAAVWSAQLLQSLGLTARAMLLSAGAALALLGCLRSGVQPPVAQAVVCGVAALALLATAVHASGDATRHR